jgi:16S rRNA (cytosine967-C5)-methyltransferase
VLSAVAERDAYANLLLPALLRERGIQGRDAAFATELTYGTLRAGATYDAILATCSDRAIDQVDAPVREVLRLGAHQLLATRVGAHAAVATSVDLAKDVSGPRPSGFVNAVLRRVATRDLDAWLKIIAPDPAADPVGYLSIACSAPRWIVEAFRDALRGAQHDARDALSEAEEALAACNRRPQVVLAAAPGRADPAELAINGGEPTRWSPFGITLAGGGDPAELPAVTSGLAAVQDEASQLAALALSRVELTGPDALWLDMCAGPGGKARILHGLAAERSARLVAADARPHRASLVRQALGGPGGPGDAAVVAADGLRTPWRAAAFDRVLADVPCSGLGSLRRRPEARWRKTPADIASLHDLQRGLLQAAIDSARPGGVIAYVTCSPHISETRDVVTEVVSARDDVTLIDAPEVLSEVPGLRCPEPYSSFAQFWPHRHGTDGIFLALLRRKSPTA